MNLVIKIPLHGQDYISKMRIYRIGNFAMML